MIVARKQTFSAIALALGALAMAGCSDTEQSTAPTGGPIFASQVANQAPAAAPAPAAAAPVAQRAPMADLSAYQELTEETLIFAYHARKPGEVDYDILAKTISRQYSRESDAFKKRDLLNELTPQIDERLAASKQAPHFTIEANIMAYGYNFETQSFQLDRYDDADVRLRYGATVGNYDVAFANTLEFKNFVVKDQALARTLEELRTKKFSSFNTRTYLTLVGLGDKANEVVTSISKVQILDDSGNVLAEY